ncbi:F-box only protein 50 [Ictalurus punctatus]|uniref:F-box only protein 50 n=1 Tax=Ictalurus punctatus TaxID=7998 RepID=Q9PTD4_ICTPU|nr:F-box only protein 50 [Ictalurus punctatus]AAF19645.1 NCC receptor protein 1 [Ictalurus punctatus]
MAVWKQKCDSEWQLAANGAPLPDDVDWKSVYEKKPLERNLLKNPSPHGLTHDTPPPEREVTGERPDPDLPPQFEPTGDFSGCSTSIEQLPLDSSGIPPGDVDCYLPTFSWFSLEQRVELKAEGLWDKLLDKFQPDIAIEDCYEESQLHASIYELHVKLLAADGQTVIKEHTCSPTEDLENYSHNWKQVSHVFSGYGPGVRYVHFQHKVKTKFMVEFFGTMVTGSSVVVKATKSSP